MADITAELEQIRNAVYGEEVRAAFISALVKINEEGGGGSGGGEPYTLPQASADALGGVKADPKTEEDTVPARIGEDGKLYVKSYPEGGGNADNGVPAGGSTGQMLVKKSDSDNDVEWKTPLTAAEVAEVVMENYLEIIDGINGEAVYTTDDLETDLDTVNGEVI